MKLRKSVFFSASVAVAMGIATIAGGCSSDNTTADAGSDTGVMDDTGADVKKDTGKETGPMDAGLMCPSPKTDISGFMAPMMAIPPITPSSVCSDVQLAAYWQACRVPPASGCAAWRTANMACDKCLESNDTDPKWGVLVYGSGQYVVNGIVQANYDGCLTILGATQCANDDFAANMCTKYACEEQCPVTDQTSYNAYSMCVQSASSGACKMYSSKVSPSCTAGDAGAAVTACKGSNFQDYYNKIAPIFCGGAPSDAGSDG